MVRFFSCQMFDPAQFHIHSHFHFNFISSGFFDWLIIVWPVNDFEWSLEIIIHHAYPTTTYCLMLKSKISIVGDMLQFCTYILDLRLFSKHGGKIKPISRDLLIHRSEINDCLLMAVHVLYWRIYSYYQLRIPVSNITPRFSRYYSFFFGVKLVTFLTLFAQIVIMWKYWSLGGDWKSNLRPTRE